MLHFATVILLHKIGTSNPRIIESIIQRTGELGATKIHIQAHADNISMDVVTKTMKSTVPLKRFGRPEETAKAIAFLASRSLL